ncbi:MAG: TrmH family RNA methyltransferase [Acidobacteriota bacterium]
MLTDTITSRNNPFVKHFIAAREGRQRHLIFIEGMRLVEEALRSHIVIEAIAYSPRLCDTPRGAQLLADLQQQPCRGALLTEAVMAHISDVETPPGIVVLGRRPVFSLPDDFTSHRAPLFILADGIQSPGNLGALIRTAEAAGATALLATVGTVDPFQPKALRAAAGSAFRLPIIAGSAVLDELRKLLRLGVRFVAADSQGDTPYETFDWHQPVLIWLGSEGHGPRSLTDDFQVQLAARLVIPMSGQVESLNVAVAGAILLYEARRRHHLSAESWQPLAGEAANAP